MADMDARHSGERTARESTPRPENSAADAISKFSRDIANALDRANIDGPLKDDIVGAASQVVTAKSTLMGMLLEGSAYDIALQVYGEKFRLNRAAIAFEAQMLKQELGPNMDAAEKNGFDSGRVACVAVAHNSLALAIGSWGHAGVFGPATTANEELEGVNVAKAKTLCRDLKYRIAQDADGQTGFALHEKGEQVLFIGIKELKAQAAAVLQLDLNSVPYPQREVLPGLIKAAFDSKLALTLCAACHIAEIPGALNARGRLLPFEKPALEVSADQERAGKALSEYYATLKSVMAEKKLSDLPSLAVMLGGPAV